MSWRDLLRQSVISAHAAYTRKPSVSSEQRARAIMMDPASSATLVTIAARHLLGPTYTAWEPETLWLELKDPCVANRDKLMAGVTLAVSTAPYTDYRAFAAVVQACNGEAVFTEDIPECTPEQLTWGRFELELLFSLQLDIDDVEPEFGAVPAGYVAACLLHAGLVVCPPGLEFAEPALVELLNPEARELRKKVHTATPNAEKTSEEVTTALGVQTDRLKDITAYLEHRAETLLSELRTF